MSEVDLRELAIDREELHPARRGRSHVMSRYVLPAALVVGFFLLVAWTSWQFFFPPTPVTVVPILSTQARSEGEPLFKAAGWIEPRPTPIRVAALAAGVVDQLLVVEDQPVKAGQAIAVLVKDDAQLAHHRANADMRLREAELDQANASHQAAMTRFEQPVHLEAALGASEATLAKLKTELTDLKFESRIAESKFEFAKKDYDGKLAAKAVVSGRALDEAQSTFRSARALVEELQGREASLKEEQTALDKQTVALRTRLKLLADEIESRDESGAKVKAANARLDQAKVSVAETKLRLDRMTIRAPLDARVYRLIGHPGAGVGGGVMTSMLGHDGGTVVTLYRPDMLQIRVDVRFEDLPRVRLNQEVLIENPAVEEPLKGKVLFVSSIADIQKNTLEVKVAINESPPVFKPEMLVDVTFLAPKEFAGKAISETRFYAPKRLVHEQDGTTFIWVADQSAGAARRISVKIRSAVTGDMVELTGDVNVSTRIIASGYESLNDGDRIAITESPN
ncbi:MAG: HlyD family efflux transporter periplasmic adaptor subunit [Pirellulales bacterium]